MYMCFYRVMETSDSSVLHRATLLRTIFASLARANECVVERVHIHNKRDFPQPKLGREINAWFL